MRRTNLIIHVLLCRSLTFHVFHTFTTIVVFPLTLLNATKSYTGPLMLWSNAFTSGAQFGLYHLHGAVDRTEKCSEVPERAKNAPQHDASSEGTGT